MAKDKRAARVGTLHPHFRMTNPPEITEYAPVAIYAHRRPEHLNRLIDGLLGSEPFARSPQFVFCDGAP
jgi:hypothetical protein